LIVGSQSEFDELVEDQEEVEGQEEVIITED